MGRRLFSAVNLLSLVLLGVVHLKIASSADETTTVKSAVTTAASGQPKTDTANNRPKGTDRPTNCVASLKNETHKFHSGDKLTMKSNIKCQTPAENVSWGFVKKNGTFKDDGKFLFVNGVPKTDDKNFVYENDTDYALTIQDMRKEYEGTYGCEIDGEVAVHVVNYEESGANYAEVGGLLMLVTTIIKLVV